MMLISPGTEFAEIRVINDADDVMVVLDYCGEGLNGDYDCSDENDLPLLRFDVFLKYRHDLKIPSNFCDIELDAAGEPDEYEDGDWLFVTGSSQLTELPRDEDRELLTGAALQILAAVEKPVRTYKATGRLFENQARINASSVKKKYLARSKELMTEQSQREVAEQHPRA
jgi:hypothetical protein